MNAYALASPPRTRQSFTLYADGGTVGGSPGQRGVYWSVATEAGVALRGRDPSGRRRRSDEAEFLALLAALRYALGCCRPGDRVVIHMDCRTVVKHVTEGRVPRCRRLAPLYETARSLLGELEGRNVSVVVRWVRRREVVGVLGH